MYNIRELLFFPYSKHREYILSELQTVEKVEEQPWKEPNSVQIIDRYRYDYHRAHGDYNAEFLYSPLKIVLRKDKYWNVNIL